jgi:phage baseplate assembly protein V
MLKNMIRIGKVSSINPAKGMVRVVIEDQQDMVTNDLPMLSNEYNLPTIGDLVLCLFLGNGISSGFCLGKYFSTVNPPPVTDSQIIYKDFGDGSCIKYDKASKTLTIKADTVAIEGNLSVTGNISATGTILDVGGNTNNHSHL